MNAHLLFPHRDFDQDESLRSMMCGYRDARQALEHQLSKHERALIQDLELNVLFDSMANGDEFLFEVARKVILAGSSNDVETVRYRQQVLKDCLNNAEVLRSLYSVTVEAIEETRKMQWSVSSYEHPASVLYCAIEILEVLSGKLRKLRLIGEEHAVRFESKAFRALFTMLQQELSDEYLATIEGHLEEVKFRKGILLSAELDNHNEGANYTLRRSTKEEPGWLKRIFGKGPRDFTFYIADGDQAGAEFLGDVRRRGIGRASMAIAQASEHVLGFFRMLRTEVGFYQCCLNLYDRLVAQGSKACVPEPINAGKRKHRFCGLYDVCLALQGSHCVVANTVNADAKDFVLVTGANQGGKSTFLRSIGVAQLMMQAGMFVAAEAFEAELCPAVFTHYKREEDAAMKSGKLDEELARMSDIAERIAPNAMILFNESFAATNEREGSEIARQVVSALLEKRIKVFYVTHLYTFAHRCWERFREQALFLRAERDADGKRTFRMIEGEPLETSFGEDLYRQVFETARSEPSEERERAALVQRSGRHVVTNFK